MPYKNKVKQREYQREWMRRKRAGENTRIINKPKLSEEERKRRKRENDRKYYRKRNKKLKEIRYSILGDHCIICNTKKRKLHSHNIYGNDHPDIYNLGEEKLKKLLLSGDFVHLCYKCHKHVHFCMEKLGMLWDEISNRLNKNS